MKEENRNNKKERKYIAKFSPDVVRLTTQYQGNLQLFNAGKDYLNFNEFLHNNEWKDFLEDKNGVTYVVNDVISNNITKIVAYYTLSTTAIPYIDRWYIPPEDRENIDIAYDEEECGISAIEIKMFAVSEEYQDVFFSFEGEEKPISAWILSDIINTIRELAETVVSTKAILLHAVPEAEEFYIKNGFDYVMPYMHTFHSVDSEFSAMYLPLTQLKIHYDE